MLKSGQVNDIAAAMTFLAMVKAFWCCGSHVHFVVLGVTVSSQMCKNM